MSTYQSYNGSFANNDHVTGIFRGLIRSTTASVIRGKNNEQRLFDQSPYGRMSKENYQRLKNDIQINGIKEPVFIVLEWNNKHDELKLEKAMADKGYFDPYSYPMDVVVETCMELFNGIPLSFLVYEGNHRIRIAKELGIDVPAEIRFFGNSNLLIPYDQRTSRLLQRLLKNDPIYSEITGESQMKRRNPSKCNDKSFSVNTSKGACTWHEGVEKEVTRAEYNKSQSRVRYGSPKGYKGTFAPRKGKSVSKPISKPKTTTKPKQQKPIGKTVVVEFEIPANFTGVVHHTVSSIISVFIVEKGKVLLELEFEERDYYIKFLMSMLVGLSVKKEKKPTTAYFDSMKAIFALTSMEDTEATFNSAFKKQKLFKLGKEYIEKLAMELRKSPVIFHDVDVLRYARDIPKHWKDGKLWLSKCKVISMVLTDSQWEYVLLNLSHDKAFDWEKDVFFYIPKSEGNAYDDKHPITSVFRNHGFRFHGLDQLKLSKKASKTLLKQVQPLLMKRYKDLHASINDVAKTLMAQGEWVKEEPQSHEHATVSQYRWYYDGKPIKGAPVYRLKKRNHDGHLYSDGDGDRGYNSFGSLAKAKEFIFVADTYPRLLKQGLIEGSEPQSKPKTKPKSKPKTKPKTKPKVPTVFWLKSFTSEDLIPQLVVLDEWGQRNDIANVKGHLRSYYLIAFKNPVQTLLKEWLEENYTRFTNTRRIDLNHVFNVFLSEVIKPFAPSTGSSGLKSQIYNNKDTWFIPKIKSTIKSLQKKAIK